MKHRLLKKITGLILAVAMTCSMAPVETSAQVNSVDSNAYKYTNKGNTAWSQQITLKDGEFFAISMTPDIDQTWTFESKGTADTFLKMDYFEDPTDIESYTVVEADEGGETTGNFKLTYDLKGGKNYTLYISGFDYSACTTTVYGRPENRYSFEALSERTFILDSPNSTGNKYPSSCTLEVGFMNSMDNNWTGNVTWYYIDESGAECFVSEENIHPGLGETGRCQVDYSNIINGKTVVYIARCSFMEHEQDIQFQVTGCSYDSGFQVKSCSQPDYVDADQEAILSVYCESSERIWYQWYYYDYGKSGYVEIPDAINSSYTIPANSYRRTGKVLYQCRVNDETMETVETFELQVNPAGYGEKWSLSADHDTMRVGDSNRLYITAERDQSQAAAPVDNSGQYIVVWSRWNENSKEYEVVTSDKNFTYTISPKESEAFSYGQFINYRCRITENATQYVTDKYIQVGISALRDDQPVNNYYFDWQSDELHLETENCSLVDPGGSYSYEWTIEGNENSNYEIPSKLASNSYFCNLNETILDEIEGEFIVSCRTTDHELDKSSICRFNVYNHCYDHFKVLYESEVVMDYINGIDLEVLTIENDFTMSWGEITWQWYKNGTSIPTQKSNKLHISPENFKLTDVYRCYVSDGYSGYYCYFSIFNSKPEKTGGNTEAPAYDEGCERIRTSTFDQFDLINEEIKAKGKYVFEFNNARGIFRKGTYEIKITGTDRVDDCEYALYDDAGVRINCRSRQQAGNIWLRFETTDSDNYHLYFYNKSGFPLLRNISCKPFDVTDNEQKGISFRTYESIILPADYEKPLDFNWDFGWSEPQDVCETVFLVDGKIVKSGSNLKELIPYLRYDLNGDQIEDITIRVKYKGYWYESTTRVYLKTLLFEEPNDLLNTDALHDKITVAQNQEIQLSYKNFFPSNKAGSYYNVDLVNVGSKLSINWYRANASELANATQVTKISSEETCMIDTGKTGTVYYIAELTNGIDTCTLTYEIQVVDSSEMEGGEIDLYGISMSVFENGLLELNAFISIPSTKTDTVASVNGKSLKDLTFVGTSFEYKMIYSVYRISFPIAPAELADRQEIRIYDPEGSEIFWTWVSGKEYLDRFLNNEEYLEQNPGYSIFMDLAKKLVLYGEAAHNYFGNIRDDSLLDILPDGSGENEEIPEGALESAILPEDYAAEISRGKIPGISYYGSSLLLRSGITLRHYFMLDAGRKITDYSFRVDGKTVNPVKNGLLYYIEIADLPVKKLPDAYRIEVTKVENSTTYSGSFRYSAMNYLKKWEDASHTQEEKELIKALYWYYKSWPRA